MPTVRAVISLMLILFSCNTNAKIKIDINHGNTENLAITFNKINANSEGEISLARELLKVIKGDLTRSGLFNVTEDSSLTLDQDAQISDKHGWANLNSAALVTAKISNLSKNRVEVKYRLWDIHANKELRNKSLKASRSDFRRVGHMIADEIYHRMTGESGYFNSRIAYIAERKNKKRIAIMDQDGFNNRFITDGTNLVLTPRFSPESERLVYVSYTSNIPTVYMSDINHQQTNTIGNFPGINAAPRFSPDGESVVIARSIEGKTDIYEVNIQTSKKKRLTKAAGINTSPSYSPDQKKIVFNSDRNGSQQLYIMNSHGTKQHRISFGQGRYSTPAWSPRGDWIAFSKILNGEFYIGVMRPDGSGERLLTKGYLVESPTWSPNGRVIIFAKQTKLKNGKTKSRLHSIDLTGENERVVYTKTDASDPAWSQLLV